MLLYFGADWCENCEALKKGALIRPEIIEESRRFERFYVDETDPNDFQKEAASSRDVSGIPTIIVYDKSGQEVDRIVGNLNWADMLAHLQTVQ